MLPGIIATIGLLLYIPGLFMVREEVSKQSAGELAVEGDARSVDSGQGGPGGLKEESGLLA